MRTAATSICVGSSVNHNEKCDSSSCVIRWRHDLDPPHLSRLAFLVLSNAHACFLEQTCALLPSLHLNYFDARNYLKARRLQIFLQVWNLSFHYTCNYLAIDSKIVKQIHDIFSHATSAYSFVSRVSNLRDLKSTHMSLICLVECDWRSFCEWNFSHLEVCRTTLWLSSPD